MLRFLTVMMLLCLAVPALAQEAPGPNQRRAPGGLTASDGIATMVADLYGEAVSQDGWPPMRYFSRRLQTGIARDRARPVPRVEASWLIHPQEAWPSDRFHAWVLNTSGAFAGRPASAAVSLGFERAGWGRRLHLIDEGGHWVIDDACLFPEGFSLSGALSTPGPSELGHDPQRIARPTC